MGYDSNKASDWTKWVVGWFIGILLATIPQMMLYSARFAVLSDRTDRNIADIKELQLRGSDPVQSMVNDVGWLKREVEKLSKKLDEHFGSKPISMSGQ